MSKKPRNPKKTKKTNTFSYTPTLQLAPLTAYQTEWDLPGLFYANASDPQIEKDVVATERAYKRFAKRYRDVDVLASVAALKTALADYCALDHTPAGKVGAYFQLRTILDANDTEADKQLMLLSERLSQMSNLVVFFPLAVGRATKSQQKEFLKAGELAPYRYLLERLFLTAKHRLSEAEEQILNRKRMPARELWISGVDKILNRRQVTYKKQTISLMEAIEKASSLPNAERPKLWAVVTSELQQLGEIAENELNAIVTDKKIDDDLRGYSVAYEARVQSYENDRTSVEALVEAISKDGFALSRSFYRLKAKLHGQKTIPYAARYDSLGTTPTIPFAQAVEICRDIFYATKDEYGTIFDEMLTRGQIDVYPKAGRSGGAFMSSDVDRPSVVFLNQVDSFASLETLAHEMGHAIHSARTKVGQPSWYESYSIATAETASTFFERLVFDAIFAQADTATQKILLHDRLTRDVATVQRQIAFFNFEREMHERIRAEGLVPHQELARMMQRHLQDHLGPAVEITEADGYTFVYVGHFRQMFYVYTYAYGHLMSNLMYQRYQADPQYIETIDELFQAGGSNTVENLFGSIGINARSLATFTDSLATMESDLQRLRRLS